VLSYFLYKQTPEDEDPKSLNWPLLSIVGVLALNSIITLIVGIVRSARSYELFDYTLGYSPFYALVIAGLAAAFYLKRDVVYRFVSKHINKFISEKKEGKENK
jgi:hypothetical protein